MRFWEVIGQVQVQSRRMAAADMSFSKKKEEGNGVIALINLLIADMEKANQEADTDDFEIIAFCFEQGPQPPHPCIVGYHSLCAFVCPFVLLFSVYFFLVSHRSLIQSLETLALARQLM